MSLLTRVFGFGLCLVGGVAIGYAQGIKSILGTIGGIILSINLGVGNLASVVETATAGYIQNTVDPSLNLYLVGGVVLVLAGLAVVLWENIKARSVRGRGQMQTQPVAVKQKE